MIWDKLRETPEGKAEIERFRTAMKAHHEAMKTLHQTIRKEIQGGGVPKEVFEAHAAEIKALIKKGAVLHIEHREKMLAIAKQYVDKFVDEMFEKMKDRKPPRPAGEDAQDGEDGEDVKGGKDEEDRPRRQRPRRRPPRRRRRRPDNDNGDDGAEAGPFNDEE